MDPKVSRGKLHTFFWYPHTAMAMGLGMALTMVLILAAA